jgi:hypothetical protein
MEMFQIGIRKGLIHIKPFIAEKISSIITLPWVIKTWHRDCIYKQYRISSQYVCHIAAGYRKGMNLESAKD